MESAPATPAPRARVVEPSTPRLSSSTAAQSSPHYSTTRRHSLYGTEDRIVLDPGSRIWKVGFSGEGRPRDIYCVTGETASPLWSLNRASDALERAEEDRLLEAKLQTALREVFHSSLLTDPKSRKVIVVENALLPLYIKEMIARILFNNLQVPSISFASSHLLSLFCVGRITGLVLDSGHLESTVLPIFAARPLFPHLKSTPLAGSRLTSHIRALLLLFGTYLPPPATLGGAANLPAASRSTRVPEQVLSDAVIEEIKTRCCFVGEPFSSTSELARVSTPQPGTETEDNSEFDVPSSDITPSEPESMEIDSPSQRESSAPSSLAAIPPFRHPTFDKATRKEGHLQALATMYMNHSTAMDLTMRVVPPVETGTGRGTLLIPGWIRERAAEVLFEGGDVDELSMAEIILDGLLKVPVDLRRSLASSILVTGGTPMLPGFIPRLHKEILRALAPPASNRVHVPSHRPPPPQYDRYAPLRPLIPYFAILNNPSPPVEVLSKASANAGKAPAFAPASMAWVGGSLAGALKTSGDEITREQWDLGELDDNERDRDQDEVLHVPASVLPDWTRTPLTAGAPPARTQPALESTPQTAVQA